jgi:hypothetical protein
VHARREVVVRGVPAQHAVKGVAGDRDDISRNYVQAMGVGQGNPLDRGRIPGVAERIEAVRQDTAATDGNAQRPGFAAAAEGPRVDGVG